ncbi:MAG: hypothetical protein AB8B97_16225 [Granulosicoccus sp.]
MIKKAVEIVLRLIGPLLIILGLFSINSAYQDVKQGSLMLKSSRSVIELQDQPVAFWIFTAVFLALAVLSIFIGIVISKENWFKSSG